MGPQVVTAQELINEAQMGTKWFVLHRGGLAVEHVSGETCWCAPLVLDRLQVLSDKRTLPNVLNSFYAVH